MIFDDDDDEPSKWKEFSATMGYIQVGVLLWPLVATLMVPLAVIYRLYAYVVLIISLFKFRANYQRL